MSAVGWRCGCGYTERELAGGASCICGLNAFRTGSVRRVVRGDALSWRFVQDQKPLTFLPLRMFGARDEDEVLGVHASDVGSVCGRWTTRILLPASSSSTAEVVHDGRPFRFVRRGDEPGVPWLVTLMLGEPLFCFDRTGRPWMLLDAFALPGEGWPSCEPPLDFLLGRPFSERAAAA